MSLIFYNIYPFLFKKTDKMESQEKKINKLLKKIKEAK